MSGARGARGAVAALALASFSLVLRGDDARADPPRDYGTTRGGATSLALAGLDRKIADLDSEESNETEVIDTTRLDRNWPFQRLPLLLRVLRLIGDAAGLDRGWAASTALKLAFGFATRSWRPLRSHSWPTGRRGRCDLLARFSPGLPGRWPRRR